MKSVRFFHFSNMGSTLDQNTLLGMRFYLKNKLTMRGSIAHIFYKECRVPRPNTCVGLMSFDTIIIDNMMFNIKTNWQ